MIGIVPSVGRVSNFYFYSIEGPSGVLSGR